MSALPKLRRSRSNMGIPSLVEIDRSWVLESQDGASSRRRADKSSRC
jgi:hypothetical protein